MYQLQSNTSFGKKSGTIYDEMLKKTEEDYEGHKSTINLKWD